MIKDSFKTYAPGIAFLAPALALFIVFTVYPIIFNVDASLLSWDGVNQAEFVGVSNYTELFSDRVFWISMRNSLLWIIFTMIPQMGLGLLFAILLNKKMRGRNVYRALFFLPVVLAPIVVGIAWKRLLDPFNGVFANVADALGLDFLVGDYLGDPSTAIFAIILVNNWMWTGFDMLYYLGGLQTIDPNVYEAAKIDGANEWQTAWKVTIPLLKSTHLSLMLLSIIGALKTFDLVYIMTNSGPNHSTEMLATYAFSNAFQLQRFGYAAAISVVLVLIAMVSSLTMTRVFGSGFATGSDKD